MVDFSDREFASNSHDLGLPTRPSPLSVLASTSHPPPPPHGELASNSHDLGPSLPSLDASELASRRFGSPLPTVGLSDRELLVFNSRDLRFPTHKR